MKENLLRAARLLQAGHDFWEVLPLLRELPAGIQISEFERSVLVRWRHPMQELDIRYQAELVRGEPIENSDVVEFGQKFAVILQEWAEAPVQVPKSEFRNKVTQELANFLDANTGSHREIAKAFYNTLSPARKRSLSYKKSRSHKKPRSREEIISSIIKKIEYIKRTRREKS